MKKTSPIYQLKVTLADSKPPIWRRILVASDVDLGLFHHILQDVMGWTDSHLHQFRAGGVIVLSIENYTFNRMFNHKFIIYNDKYQFSLSHV